MGDSITAAFNYVAGIAAFYKETYPERRVRFYNCGVSGGTAATQRWFLEDDTFCHKPTHAVITLGVNDSGRWALAEEKSADRYRTLYGRISLKIILKKR